MNHHAFYVAGDAEEGIGRALFWGERILGLPPVGNPDVVVLSFQLFSVEEARKVHDIVHRMPIRGDKKLIIISAERMFHETQNALLKVFEEPPSGTTLILVVPSDGVLIPTLRSRLLPLPSSTGRNNIIYDIVSSSGTLAEEFLKAGKAEREKIVAKILERAKSDKPEEKQAARSAALDLVTDLTKALYPKRADADVRAFLADMNRFIPILHERSAPLKLILEHILLTTPHSL